MAKAPVVNKVQKCKIRSDWFTKLDCNGKPFGRWLIRVVGSNKHVLCTICNSQLNCEVKGFQAIVQHSESLKHKSSVKSHSSQLRLTPDGNNGANVNNHTYASGIPDAASNSSTRIDIVPDNHSVNTLQLMDLRDETTKAEIIWTMKNVSSNYSGRSCDDISETFQKMFPNEPSCKEFTLGHTKLSYMVTDCVGPHFRDIFSVRYYSSKQKRIQECHLETFFIENGKGETIVKYLLLSLENAKLPIERLLTLSRDGPNVNKKIFRLMNEEFKKKTGRNLIDIGSCDIHIIHNGFKKGLDIYGKDIADLSVNLHYFFEGEALRSEEYRDIQRKHGMAYHRFIKHVPTRWLTLLDSVLRIIEQMPVIEEYFSKYIPKSRPEVMNSISYKNVIRHFKSGTLKAEIYMVKESAELLQLYLKYLQVDRSIIHKLHEIISQILTKVLARIAKPSTLVQISTITTENFDTQNLKPIDDIALSEDLVKALKDCKDVEKSKFRLEYRNHFKEIGLHILRKTCYTSRIVQCVNVIAPAKILDVDSLEKMLTVVNSLPHKIPTSTFIDEWSLVKATVQNESLFKFEGRIDDFWVNFFDKVGMDNTKMFSAVSKVVESVLTIAHGSGGVERIISQSGLILTDNKTRTTIRTLNARLDIKYGLKLFFNDNHNLVPVDKNFITAARRARQSFQLYLDDLKKKEAEEKKKQIELANQNAENIARVERIAREKKSVKDIETIVAQKEKEHSNNATKVLEEANDRLKEAIRKKNLSEISLAQGMLEGAKAMILSEQQESTEILKLKLNVEKRKSAIIDNYIKITPK